MNLSTIQSLYGHSLALLTDLYQLTMAQAYWACGKTDQHAAFHLTFRSNPFDGGFAVTCGQSALMDYLEAFQFDPDDLAYLSGLTGSDGSALFDEAFLDYLGRMQLEVEVWAMPEGTLAFPHEPIVRVTGPILQCQLLETPTLNLVNFPTLIATKAARICRAAGDEPVLEFGVRRAQGIDGGVTASRSACVGGCAATSNVLAGKLFDLDVKGTHAHSWVMSFDREIQALDAWARAMPHNSIFLVDTYDTLSGVRRTIDVGKAMRDRGFDVSGVRLDSGDLAYLSKQTRRILDQAGFESTRIVASGDLDEYLIQSLHNQGACIDIWGVGTKLATAYDEPALGGVYKLSAVRDDAKGPWNRKVKLSEQKVKTTDPGVLQVRRFSREDKYVGDAIYDIAMGLCGRKDDPRIVDPRDETRSKLLSNDLEQEDLLEPLYRKGRGVASKPTVRQSREKVRSGLSSLDEGCLRFENPHEYPAGLAENLNDLKTQLILRARREKEEGTHHA
jgi:nicotinate phosphoribosyltransferase